MRIGKEKEQNGGIFRGMFPLKNIEPFIDEDLRTNLLKPIQYKQLGGTVGQGLPAELLPKICEIWLKARENGGISALQEITAKKLKQQIIK